MPMSYSPRSVIARRTMNPPQRPPSREDYYIREHQRQPDRHGRLGYGGQKPKLVGCEILNLTDIGALVETYAPVDAAAKFFTLEIDGQYHRAQLVKSEGRQILLAFFKEELSYLDAP
jgi:hypothetical protein